MRKETGVKSVRSGCGPGAGVVSVLVRLRALCCSPPS